MRQFAIVIFLSIGLGACALNPPQRVGPVQVEQPLVYTGASWSYRLSDGFNGLPKGDWNWRIKAINASQIEAQISEANSNTSFTVVYQEPWNIVRRNLPLGGSFAFSPPLVSFAFPLSPDQNWQQRTTATELTSGKIFHWRITTKVYGWERITVPAGEFDALKVVRYLNLDDDTPFRTETRRIETDWYSPEVKGIVRRETQGEYFLRQKHDARRETDRENWELTRYKPGKF